MKKKRKWKNVLIALLVILFLVVTGLGVFVGITERQFRQALTAGGNNTALVVYTVNADGSIKDDGQAQFINADEPLVMASAMKVVVLAAYAEAVVEGAVDLQDTVSIA